MEKTTNLFSYPPNLLQIEPTQNMDINIGNTSRDKGKREIDEDLMMVDSQDTPTKKPKEMKDLLVKVVEYATHTITTKEGKVVDTEKTIRDHYNDLTTASEMKRNKIRKQLRVENPPQMLTTLDKESQMMKVAVIQPPIRGQFTDKEITEFKLNRSQFSIVEKVDFFKQTSELICSDLIATLVSKDKLFRENKKL